MKRPKYRKWRSSSGRYVFGKFWGDRYGQSFIISFDNKKVRVPDNVYMEFTQYSPVHDRAQLPVATKKQFESALELAQKKLHWLSRQTKF